MGSLQGVLWGSLLGFPLRGTLRFYTMGFPLRATMGLYTMGFPLRGATGFYAIVRRIKKIKLGSKKLNHKDQKKIKSGSIKKLNQYFCSRATEKPEGEGSKKLKFVSKKLNWS